MMASLLVACSDLRAPLIPSKPVSVSLEAADPDVGKLLLRLSEAVRTTPDSARVRGRYAMALDINGFRTAAVTTYRQAGGLDDSVFEWPYLAAVCLGKLGDPVQALHSVDRALAVRDDYVPAWLWQGEWLLAVGDIPSAAAAFERALDLGGEDAAAAGGLARTMMHNAQYADALTLLEDANRATPYAFLYRLIGDAHQALGQHGSAKVAFARGRQDLNLGWLDPAQARLNEFNVSFNARLRAAERRIDNGDAPGALVELKELRRKNTKNVSLIRARARAYSKTGKPEFARSTLRSGLRAQPDSYHLHVDLAGVHRDGGDTQGAIAHMQRAIDIIPGRGRAHYLLALALREAGRTQEARQAIETALRLGVPSPENALYTAGMIEVKQSNWTAAIDRFRQATEVNVAFTNGYVALALSLAETGRFVDAHKTLTQARSLGNYRREVTEANRDIAGMETAAR